MKEIKSNIIPFILLGLIALALGLISMDEGHEFGDDFALYLEQAEYIFQPSEYAKHVQQNTECMKVSDAVIGPNSYPIGFPLFLKLLQSIGGTSDLRFLKIVLFAFFLFAATRLTFEYVKNMPNRGIGILTCALIVFSPKVIEASDRLLSDLLFSAFVFLFFAEIKTYKDNFKSDIFLLFWLLCAQITRPTGILLAISLIVFWWFRNSNRTKFGYRVISLVFVLFLVRWTQGGGDSIYMSVLKSGISVESIRDNLLYYSALMVKLPFWNYLKIADQAVPIFSLVVGMLFAVLFVWVLIYDFFKSYTQERVFLVLHLTILLAWPSLQGVRLLFPVFPIYMILLIHYLSGRVGGWINLKFKKPIVSLLVLLCFIQGFATAIHYYKTDTNQAFSVEMRELSQFIARKVDKNTYISFFKPRLLRYQTHNRAVRVQNSVDYSSPSLKLNKSVHRDSLLRKGIGYYVAPRFDYDNLRDEKVNKKNFLTELSDDIVIFQNKQFVVFKLKELDEQVKSNQQ